MKDTLIPVVAALIIFVAGALAGADAQANLIARHLDLTKEALHAFRGNNKAVVFQRLSVLECEQETMLGLRKGPC